MWQKSKSLIHSIWELHWKWVHFKAVTPSGWKACGQETLSPHAIQFRILLFDPIWQYDLSAIQFIAFIFGPNACKEQHTRTQTNEQTNTKQIWKRVMAGRLTDWLHVNVFCCCYCYCCSRSKIVWIRFFVSLEKNFLRISVYIYNFMLSFFCFKSRLTPISTTAHTHTRTYAHVA